MKKSSPAASPAEYVSTLSGWQRTCVESLRAIVTDLPKLDERIKWRHLVYTFNGPVLLIRAEERRVLFGFWRGKRLREIEKRLKPGGKYEMATIELHDGDELEPAVVRRLVKKAVALNESLGDPTHVET
jgi:hypothetical protein